MICEELHFHLHKWNRAMTVRIPVDQNLNSTRGCFLHISLRYLIFTVAVLHCSQKGKLALITMSDLVVATWAPRHWLTEASGINYSKWARTLLQAEKTMPQGLCNFRCLFVMDARSVAGHNSWLEIRKNPCTSTKVFPLENIIPMHPILHLQIRNDLLISRSFLFKWAGFAVVNLLQNLISSTPHVLSILTLTYIVTWSTSRLIILQFPSQHIICRLVLPTNAGDVATTALSSHLDDSSVEHGLHRLYAPYYLQDVVGALGRQER